MSDKSRIIWEKWRDPFLGYDDNEIDIDNSISSSIENDYYDGDDEDKEVPINKNNFIKVIATPMGMIPYNEYTASGKIFNFWIGHTNFNISRPIARAIENTEGIETLDIFTRYRFRIGIGKAFEDRNVMRLVDSRVQEIIYESRRTQPSRTDTE